MAEAFPEIDVLDVGRLLLNYVLSDLYVDVALTGVREPRFVELNNEISDDVASRIDLAVLHDRYVDENADILRPQNLPGRTVSSQETYNV
jgi:hypothetical protein